MNNVNAFLEKFNKLIGGLTILTLVFGYVDLFWFYLSFDIYISDYISVSEIIIASIGNLIVILLTMIIPLVVSISLMEDLKTFNLQPRPFKQWLLKKNILAFFIIFFLTLAGIVTGTYLADDYYSMKFFRFCLNEGVLTALSCFYTIDFFKDSYTAFEQKHKNPIQRLVIIIAGYLFLFTLVNGSAGRASDIKSDKYFSTDMSLYLNDSLKITTNDSIKYIGKTQSFYFLFNRIKHSTIIYPSSEIKKIVFTNVR